MRGGRNDQERARDDFETSDDIDRRGSGDVRGSAERKRRTQNVVAPATVYKIDAGETLGLLLPKEAAQGGYDEE